MEIEHIGSASIAAFYPHRAEARRNGYGVGRARKEYLPRVALLLALALTSSLALGAVRTVEALTKATADAGFPSQPVR